MKTPKTLCRTGIWLVVGLAVQVSSALAQEVRFYRVLGPVAATILDLTPEGTITWTNVSTNATFTVQTATAILGESNWVDWVQVPATNPLTVHRIFDLNPPAGMALIPAGSFTMGDVMNDFPGSYEHPVHTVYVSAFYMDRTEVTKALWDEVYQWAVTNGYSFDNLGSWFEGVSLSKGPNHPVHLINWDDTVKWCNARSEKEGRVPAYYTSAAQTTVYRSGQVDVQNDWVKWNAGGYRLPTEAEWEKAARGGSSGRRFPWGNVITHNQANYISLAGGEPYDTSPTRGNHPTFDDGVWPYTSPVGYFAPNGYGLHDVAGNVWELCWDWWSATYYSSSPGADPRGPTSGNFRVMRGGSWGLGEATGERSACRNRNDFEPPQEFFIGFRCVMVGGSDS